MSSIVDVEYSSYSSILNKSSHLAGLADWRVDIFGLPPSRLPAPSFETSASRLLRSCKLHPTTSKLLQLYLGFHHIQTVFEVTGIHSMSFIFPDVLL